MIFLIDDKKRRQEQDFNWTHEKISAYKDSVKNIYTLNELEEWAEKIFQNGNTILYHESFLDKQKISDQAVEKRVRLENFAKSHPDFNLVFFSGSKSSRFQNGNTAYLPVATLYQNLEVYINKHSKGNNDLKYLLFGQNPSIEEELLKRRELAISVLGDCVGKSYGTKNIIFRPSKGHLFEPIEGAKEVILRADVSDEKLTQIIEEYLTKEEFDNIFIPVCFGNVLSDFNGLRFAAHVRCSESINQLKPIFIYSFVHMGQLIGEKYFNVLKLKNVDLIKYNTNAFQEALEKITTPLFTHELAKDVKKLALNPPENYDDNHSISNEWAIYRWANSIGSSDEAIAQITKNVNESLYFKYLSTIYPVSAFPKLSEDELKVKDHRNTSILYIDDEADKGWFEIFSVILCDLNSFDFQYLDTELDSKSKNEIIDLGLKKVIEDDIGIVILDFRLHQDDFSNTNIDQITGLRLLKEIKKHNLGIQVIIFSATSKVWNLEALKNAGADGFVLKEAPENSVDFNFTTKNIENFIRTFEKCLSKSFLKEVFSLIDPIADLVKTESKKNPSKFSLSIQQTTIQNINQRIEIFKQLINNFPSNLEWPFSTLVLIIEEIVNEIYIDDGSDHVVEVDIFEKVKCVYNSDLGRFLSIKPNNNSNYINEQYLIPKDEIVFYNKSANRAPFNFRLTCILHFKYDIPLGVEIFKYFPIYKLRSTSVMHVGSDKVAVSDIKLAIDLLKKLIK
jgi:CheY-like chemotaxis protein